MEKKELAAANFVHIGYVVPDMEEYLKIFQQACGAGEFDIYDFEPIEAWMYGEKTEDCKLKIAVGKNADGTGIEVIQPVSGETTPHMRFVRGGSEGIHHICYVVEDVEAWREHLIRDAGMRIILDVKVFDEVHRFRHCIYAQKGESGPIVEYLEKAENIPE